MSKQMIKEYFRFPEGNPVRFIVRRPDYGSKVEDINELAEIAKRDFPQLDDNVLDLIHYGGQRYKGTYGIEFNLDTAPPSDYREISQVELVL